MNIQLEDGSFIGGERLISALYRTDLVPVPVTLELVVRADDALYTLLSVDKSVVMPNGVHLVVVKSQVINQQGIKAGHRIAALHVVAVLAGCQALIGVTKRAVSLESTSFNQIYRALGAKIRIKKDIKVSRFVCLKGQIPTTSIAEALQREAAVVCHTDDGVNVIGLNDLFVGEATLFDKSAVQWIDNPNAVRRGNINYLSIDDNGSDIIGQAQSERGLGYYPRANTRELQNLRRILITKATIIRQLDERLNAGKLIQINDQKLVALTAAHRYDTGAAGGNSVMATRAWLAQVEKHL
ncbi:hypothetical protein [Psychrobacter aestuarii]|uniref:Phage tail protein n=1 Tax=Psychrobacter aestuarii TaxID=556327 RepID=A0ABN0VWT9_9GAMM|nr:hypothetical protein [Psychrobacter aestuarii]